MKQTLASGRALCRGVRVSNAFVSFTTSTGWRLVDVFSGHLVFVDVTIPQLFLLC